VAQLLRKDLRPGDLFSYTGTTTKYMVPKLGKPTPAGFFLSDMAAMEEPVDLLGSDCVPGAKMVPVGKPDMVEAPVHYTRLSPQPIEVIEAWDLDFFTGSAIKYLARAGHKAGADAKLDLQKAISFIQRKVDKMDGKSVARPGYVVPHVAGCDGTTSTPRGCACGADHQ
jgi:hypothetical protein